VGTLERRRSVLDGLLSDASDGMMLSHWIDGDGPRVYEAPAALGLERIISNRLGNKHQPGHCA
jgi:hypothetical protein